MMSDKNKQNNDNTLLSTISQQFDNFIDITSEWWTSLVNYIQNNNENDETDENDETNKTNETDKVLPAWYLDSVSTITWKQLVENSKIFVKIKNIDDAKELNRPPPLLDVSTDEIN